jgi:hypothetical protein
MRATPTTMSPPVATLEAVAAYVGALPERLPDALAPRPRTLYRLLSAGAMAAAWEVAADNAVGVVEAPFHASTATGSPRASSRLPLLTRVEPPTVFAELPGFRDPRFNAPDDCYDITTTIGLKHHLDELQIDEATATFGGWAALDVLATDPTEQVRLVLSGAGTDIATAGRRVRRPDLVAGKGEALRRRAWAGWSVRVELGDPRLAAGSWALSLEVEQRGICRRVKLGREVSPLARAAADVVIRAGARTLRWEVADRQWMLIVERS